MGCRYDLYIGGDNGSRMIDQAYLDKVVKWAGSVLPNRYTLLGGQGYFEGTQEDSLVLSAIIDGELELEREVLQLKKELG
jgi:hypothetical protein